MTFELQIPEWETLEFLGIAIFLVSHCILVYDWSTIRFVHAFHLESDIDVSIELLWCVPVFKIHEKLMILHFSFQVGIVNNTLYMISNQLEQLKWALEITKPGFVGLHLVICVWASSKLINKQCKPQIINSTFVFISVEGLYSPVQ